MKTVPTTDRGRESLRRIVDTAAELFYRHGVNATGLAQVAEASGTGKGQLYHFFTDKADLVMAVVRRQVEISSAVITQTLEPVTRPADLHSWADQLIALQSLAPPPRCPLGALVVETAGVDEQIRRELSAGFAHWRAVIAAKLDQLDRRTPPAHPSTADLAETFVAAYEGGILLGGAHHTGAALSLVLHAITDWIITHLGPEAPRR